MTNFGNVAKTEIVNIVSTFDVYDGPVIRGTVVDHASLHAESVEGVMNLTLVLKGSQSINYSGGFPVNVGRYGLPEAPAYDYYAHGNGVSGKITDLPADFLESLEEFLEIKFSDFI